MTGRPTERLHGWADSWVAPALVAVAAVVVFLRSVFGAFVFDDLRFITENEFVTRRPSWLRLVTDASTVDPTSPGGIVRPLRTVEYAADWALFGGSPAAFHVHSMLWHVVAAVLLVLVLRRLLGDGRAAFVAAICWAVHPVQTESVAWISSRGDVAMGACSLVAVLFALRAEGFDRNLAVSLVATFVAALYKESGVALPIVVAALRWTRLSRAPLWPYFVVGAVYLVYWRAVQGGPVGHGPIFVLGGSTAGTFATMFRGFGFYVAETLLPAQSLDWYLSPSTTLFDVAALAWLAAHVALVASAVLARRTAPAWTLAVVWFYAFLLPVANWPVFLSIPTAERFLYMPLAGCAVALGWALSRAPRGALTAALAAAVVFAGTSVGRTGMWRDNETMWRAALADHESPRAHEELGELVAVHAIGMKSTVAKMPPGAERDEADRELRRRLEESLDHFHRSIALCRDFERAERTKSHLVYISEFRASNLCWHLLRDQEALFHAEESLLVDDQDLPQPHYDLALPLLRLGYAPHAMEAMRRAMDAGYPVPDDELGHFFIDCADLCARQEMLVAARAGYETAVETSPDGPLRAAARARLASLRGTTHTADDDARERERRAELDAGLARLRRSCPWRHDLPSAKPDQGATAVLAWLTAVAVAGAAVGAAALLRRRLQ